MHKSWDYQNSVLFVFRFLVFMNHYVINNHNYNTNYYGCNKKHLKENNQLLNSFSFYLLFSCSHPHRHHLSIICMTLDISPTPQTSWYISKNHAHRRTWPFYIYTKLTRDTARYQTSTQDTIWSQHILLTRFPPRQSHKGFKRDAHHDKYQPSDTAWLSRHSYLISY